jgi:exopolysaccharide biosynthesis polyprenyl glycosylphosphotransferase
VISSRRRRPASRYGGAHWIADVGLAAVLWMTLVLLLSADRGGHRLVAVSIATAVWIACLRTARRGLPLVFGPASVAAAGTAVGLVLVSALQPWLRLVSVPNAPVVLLQFAVAVFVVTTVWWAIADRARVVRRVMIVGTDHAADEVAAELSRAMHGLVEVVGVVDAGEEQTVNQADETGLREFEQILQAQQPDLVVVADDQSCGAAIAPMLDLGDASPNVVGVAGLFEHLYGCVPVGHLSPTWFMSLLHVRQRPYSAVAKRLFDVIGAALGLLVSCPLFAIFALCFWRSGAPLFYRQVRVGHGGRPFEMIKFRTMRPDAEALGISCWACVDDPRATRFGHMLRKTHLDELPQFWNVLRGDMSIVGPRPERPEFISELEQSVPYWGRRLLIKPGLTGWAQIHSGYASDVDGSAAKLSYDLWYLRHRSVLLDLAICMKTFSSLLAGPGRGR